MKESRVFSKSLARCMSPPPSPPFFSSLALLFSPLFEMAASLACLVGRRKAPTVEAPGERAAASSLPRSLTLVRRSPLSFPPSLACHVKKRLAEEDENHVHELLHMYWTQSDNFTQSCEKVCAAARTVAWLDVGKRRSHRYSRG